MDHVNEMEPEAKLVGARILVVDDNDLSRELTTCLLEGVGAVVSSACNGVDAITLLCHENFDCMLMDIHMPLLGGVETARLIRASLTILDMPIIAVTSDASDEDRTRYVIAGMNDVITKPVKKGPFYTTIAKWL